MHFPSLLLPPLKWGAIGLLAALALALPLTGQVSAPGAFLAVEVDEAGNRLLLEIPENRLGTAFLYQNTLATGLGSARASLDRGQLGVEAVVRLERRGSRVLLIREHVAIQAMGGSAAEQRAARESFPATVLGQFPIVGEEGGQVRVDATSFFLSDVFGVVARLRSAGQGSFRLDRDRSWIEPTLTRSFPGNSEIRVALTYLSDDPGPEVRASAADGQAITLEQHHSLVALPDADGFRPRAFDFRSGISGSAFFDFAQGWEGTYRDAWANRWRLIPSDPAAYLRGEKVEPQNPVIYYLDPGIPEPYRTAFLEGGLWWNEIFEAAGFRNAFQVRDLPDGVDPMDSRVSMIYWVHRRDPGPSVGPSFRDPRTGEILKTVVRMDSHRSLIDANIYAGLLPAAGPTGLNVDLSSFLLARRRQHSAHEIGHTLGLPHNFIAGAQGRSSVMDYPAPQIHLDAHGQIDLSRAYREGGGAWDTLAIRYAYTWYPDAESERAGLARLVQDALDAGLRFITGGHASASGSIPEATQWVEGDDMMEGLQRTTAVRRLLIDRFDESAVDPGEPLALLNMRFAHVYLHHRYSLEATTKYIGGMDFRYAARGDGQVPARVLPPEDQRRALEMILDALEPEALAIPDRIANLIPPTPFGLDDSALWIESPTGPAFDPIGLAGGLATEIVEGLLQRERAARLVSFHARDPRNPGLIEVVDALVERSWGAGRSAAPTSPALRRVVQRVVLNTLLDRAGDRQATPEVRAAMEYGLDALGDRLRALEGRGDAEDRAHRAAALRDLERYFTGLDDPSRRSRYRVVPLPWP
jgi:hypothetical protein